MMKLWTKRFLLSFFTICFSTSPALYAIDSAKLLRKELTEIFSDRRFPDTQWGVAIISLDRKELLFEKNSRKLYVPASNNKILTIAAALLQLGPDYRFKTQVFAEGSVVHGALKGNLIVAGFGDPSSSSRMGSKDPRETFRDWAAKLKTQGIRSIEGKIIGNDSSFEESVYGRGWAWDDLMEGYAAPISALQFNENMITLELFPGSDINSFAKITTKPLSNYPAIDPKVRTQLSGSSPSIDITQDRASETLSIRGTVPMNTASISRPVAVQFPIQYYLAAFKQVLTEEGIETTNCKIEESREALPQSATLLWTHNSLPLSDLLQPALKLSLNLFNETLLRVMGLELRGEGSYLKGKEAVDEALVKMDIPKDGYSYADASGLSRLNLVSAEMMIRILTYMHQHQYFPYFYSSLSIAGVDGTLKNRMIGTSAGNNVHAKTGTLSHVSAISGYVKTSDGEMLAFSIIANNFPGSKELAENLQNSVLIQLADFSRKGKDKQTRSQRHKKQATARH
jgi:serine-type D-Ala-D-Ala carboxypeptidase/endopeptidase (penicillin-binding protein 4)